MAGVWKGGEWKSEKILEKQQAISSSTCWRSWTDPPQEAHLDMEELEFLLVAVLGIEPRALGKLGKRLPLSQILSPVLNIWRARTRREAGRQRGSRQRTHEHSTLWMQSSFSPESAGEKEATGCIFQCCFSIHTHLHVSVCVVFWYRTQSWECGRERASGCELTPILQNEHMWVYSLKKAERSGLIKVGFPPVSVSKSYVTSLLDATASCYRVILKITILETVEERAVKGKYPSNWRAINGKPMGKMGIYNMTNLTTIETLWIRVL